MATDNLDFDAAYIKSLPTDPMEAAAQLCADYNVFIRRGDFQGLKDYSSESAPSHLVDATIRATQIAQTLCARLNLESANKELNLSANKKITPDVPAGITAVACSEQQLYTMAYRLTTLCGLIGRYKNHTETSRLLNSHFEAEYTFTEGDLRQIQEALNQLRNLIQATTSISAEHRQRVLAALEKLQRELHKHMSDLDAFWGFMGKIAPILKENGQAVQEWIKPLEKLKKIFWSSEARAAELPSLDKPPADFLPEPDAE